ncbi:MAG: DUF2064 domain-containing protein [Myxococcales bacterium]|nr:DUF2064 domain-containing protein [Myxococcales bacterium]
MNMTVCLFAKAPSSGKAKTRLSPALGEQGAARLARALLLDALDSWQSTDLLIAHTGDVPTSITDRFSMGRSMSQGEGDLGQRMERVLASALESSDAAMVVGTDIPGLGERDAELARIALDTHDAVIGPSHDGGFYLLGLKHCSRGLLDGLPWSSSETLSATKSRLEERGMSVALLDARFDVDVQDDLSVLGGFLTRNPTLMPHTRHFMNSEDNRAVSVVIPALNEAARLESQLGYLETLSGIAEVIVVDGGSTDGSISIAERQSGARLLHSAKGRARQMNAGAQAAFGGILLFLHVDARLPGDACQQIHQALRGNRAGAFRLVTDYDPKGYHRPWVAPFLRLADMRSRYTQLPYGDQAIFVRSSTFLNLAGYPELPLFEDLELAMRLRKLGPLGRAPGPVRVSGRRFQERPLYYLVLMNTFPLLYRLGVSPERLASFYQRTK